MKKQLLTERFQQLAGLKPLYELNEVKGPIENIERHIKRGESVNDLDQYGFEKNVDGVPIEDLFIDGKAVRDMSIVVDQRGSMYLMNTEDIRKYH